MFAIYFQYLEEFYNDLEVEGIMSQLCYFRCAKCGEIVSVTYSSYAENAETGPRELEATEKCFSCGYVPFRVRDSIESPERELATVDWLE